MRRSVLVGFKFLPKEVKKKFALKVDEENVEKVFEHFNSEVGENYIKPRIKGNDNLPVFSLSYRENDEDVELKNGGDLLMMLDVEPPIQKVDVDIDDADFEGMKL